MQCQARVQALVAEWVQQRNRLFVQFLEREGGAIAAFQADLADANQSERLQRAATSAPTASDGTAAQPPVEQAAVAGPEVAGPKDARQSGFNTNEPEVYWEQYLRHLVMGHAHDPAGSLPSPERYHVRFAREEETWTLSLEPSELPLFRGFKSQIEADASKRDGERTEAEMAAKAELEAAWADVDADLVRAEASFRGAQRWSGRALLVRDVIRSARRDADDELAASIAQVEARDRFDPRLVETVEHEVRSSLRTVWDAFQRQYLATYNALKKTGDWEAKLDELLKGGWVEYDKIPQSIRFGQLWQNQVHGGVRVVIAGGGGKWVRISQESESSSVGQFREWLQDAPSTASGVTNAGK